MLDITVEGVWDDGQFRSKLEMKGLPDDAFVQVMDMLRKARAAAKSAGPERDPETGKIKTL